MDYQKSAKEVLHAIGEADNIVSAAHCATRLRLVIADNSKLNKEERELIYAIYFEEKTLKDIANTQDTNPMKISRIRDRILRKLRDMLDR